MSKSTVAGRVVPEGYSDRLYNEDLAPARERRWGSYSIFALWMSDVHNLGNYTFAAGLFVIGLSAPSGAASCPATWSKWRVWPIAAWWVIPAEHD